MNSAMDITNVPSIHDSGNRNLGTFLMLKIDKHYTEMFFKS